MKQPASRPGTGLRVGLSDEEQSVEGAQRDGEVAGGGGPAAEEPVAQADRLFVNLTEQAARTRPAPAGPMAPTRRKEGVHDEAPPVEAVAGLAEVAEALEMVRAAMSVINDRLVALERHAPDGTVDSETAERALDQLGRALRRSTSVTFPLDGELTSKEDVEACTGWLPVLGLLPLVERRADRLGTTGQTSREERRSVEAYRALRTSVTFLGLGRQVHTLQITSPLREEGKSTVAANLAVALASTGVRVIALSADLRRPRLHRLFGLTNTTGFTSVLRRRAPLQEVIQQVPDIPSLKLVASGPTPSNPSELLVSDRAAEIIQVLEGQCDVLLIDCPPVLPVTDAVAMAQQVQATMVVVNAGMTSRRDLHRTIEALRQVQAPLLGTVVNGISVVHRGYGLGFGGRYDYDSDARPEAPGSEDHAGTNGRP